MKRSSFLVASFGLAIVLAAHAATAQEAKVPQRADIADQYKWHLQDIYPDTVAWQADFAALKSHLGDFDKFKGHLGESGDVLYQCLVLRDNLNSLLDRLYVYAFMKKDEDTRVASYQVLSDKVATLSAQFGEAVSFIRPEIVAIPDSKLMEFLASSEKLRLYDFFIKNIIRLKPHILTSEEESILALSAMATRAPSNIFDMIDNADIKFPTIKDEKGHPLRLTHERYYKILESTNRRVRRDASKAYNEAYLNYINTLGATLSGSVNADWFYAQTRGYRSTLDQSLDGDSIPMAVFDNLIRTVDQSLPTLHRWTDMKKKYLKLDKIYPYDLSVPYAPEAKIEIPYDSAEAVVLAAVAPLGEKYVSNMKAGFRSGWVDVYETEGKQSGAYSWGAYTTHPYVLLNYSNSTENIFTVAHEMGHAMHSFYTHAGVPYVYENYSTFVAEIASTTNEALLVNYLLKHTDDKRRKLFLLNYYIEQIIGTFYTQVMFSEFEKAIHDVVEQGGALSAESMRKIYGDLYMKYWGPELSMEDWQNIGGLRIPHFYNSYYVFQYATSYAAAHAFSQKILSGDDEARQRYLALLSKGGSNYPVDLLKEAGVDMTQPVAVDATIKLFADLVNQVDSLTQEPR